MRSQERAAGSVIVASDEHASVRRKPGVSTAVNNVSSRALDDGALHAEFDRPVIGRHLGLDDVAVAQVFSALGLS
jgi:hypothetical protein